MKTKFITLFINMSFILISQNSKNIENSTYYANFINSDDLRSMLYEYSSDKFMGREAGTKGQKLAVDYLKEKYRFLKISSAKKNGDYFQYVPLIAENTKFSEVKIENKLYKYFNDFIVKSAINGSKLINTDSYAYVGYGIKDLNYNDYSNIDVKNKVVVAISGEPIDKKGKYIITKSKKKSIWSSSEEEQELKLNLAINNGASGFILIDDYYFRRYSNYYQIMASKGESNVTLNVPQKQFLNIIVGNKIGKELKRTNNGIYNKKIKLSYNNKSEPFKSENVIAMIKGSEFPNEYIIISAHLDHIGAHDGKIFNGADDDGSGTIAILEIAEAFKEAEIDGFGPKRSIVFLHVTAEEKGLLGSKYYTDFDPIVPLENTIANLNIDMIGRTDPNRNYGKRNYIYLIGSDKLSTELHEISELVNEKYTNLELDYTYNDENDPNRFYYRSDHYNFVKNNIPVIFYFNGTHEDYHRASDTADKIEYDLLENRTRLIFHTAWELANRKNKIKVN